MVSSFDPHTIYYGGNFLFKSANRGDDWVKVVLRGPEGEIETPWAERVGANAPERRVGHR